MGLPAVVTAILIGRAVTLENAKEGIKLFWASWHTEKVWLTPFSPALDKPLTDFGKLASGSIWQTACGQVFFSTGVGFGYFTSYASYNRRHSNAVVDAMAIVASNVLFENLAAFTVFGVVGFLRMWPWDNPGLGSFTVGFLTLPQAVSEMPGANFWAFSLFFTLMVLGFSSAFAQLDAVITMVMDSGVRFSRPVVVTALTIISFLLSLPYCTEFGYYLLEGVDTWTNNVALVFVVLAECVASTTVYRWKDVVGQVGLSSFIIYNLGYFGGMLAGVLVAHTVSPVAGAAVGFGLYCAFSVVSSINGKTPDAETPKCFSHLTISSRFWWLAFYSVSCRLWFYHLMASTNSVLFNRGISFGAISMKSLAKETTGRYPFSGVHCSDTSRLPYWRSSSAFHTLPSTRFDTSHFIFSALSWATLRSSSSPLDSLYLGGLRSLFLLPEEARVTSRTLQVLPSMEMNKFKSSGEKWRAESHRAWRNARERERVIDSFFSLFFLNFPFLCAQEYHVAFGIRLDNNSPVALGKM